MKLFVLLIAALAATPAASQVYQCRSTGGAVVAVQVEPAGNRMAIHDGRTRTLLCGRGAAPAKCGRLADGGFAYDGRLGKIQFVPPVGTFGTAGALRMQARGEAAWTHYMCLAADAQVRRLFAGRR
jgi:hypothetical protein